MPTIGLRVPPREAIENALIEAGLTNAEVPRTRCCRMQKSKGRFQQVNSRYLRSFHGDRLGKASRPVDAFCPSPRQYDRRITVVGMAGSVSLHSESTRASGAPWGSLERTILPSRVATSCMLDTFFEHAVVGRDDVARHLSISVIGPCLSSPAAQPSAWM